MEKKQINQFSDSKLKIYNICKNNFGLEKYLTIMLKYNGNLPSSDNTAMLVVLLCTPRMNLHNFKCIFSHNDPE
jgi:hypothetical protein